MAEVSDEVRAYVEQLRAKYREEALDAVRAAEIRGFEKAKLKYEGVFESQSQEIESLRNSNQILHASLKSTSIGVLNSKEIMELVYRGVKSEWKDDDEGGKAVLHRMKSVLIATSDILSKTFPSEVCLLKPNGPVDTQPLQSSASLGPTAVQPSLPAHRPKVLQVYIPAHSPKYYVEIFIVNTDEFSVQRLLGNSVVTKYTIESNYKLWITTSGKKSSPQQESFKYRQDRRYKEFQLLYQNLRRDFPYVVIPSLPEIDSSKELTSSIVLRRKRQLALWLQYVSLHEALQLSDPFLEFLSVEASNSQQQQQQQQAQQSKRRNSFLTKQLATVDDTKLSSSSKRALIRELGYRNILTVKRDLNQLQPQASQAIDGAAKLVHAFLNLSLSFKASDAQMQAVATVERNYPREYSSWNSMRYLSSHVADASKNIAYLYQIGIYEPLSFFGENCIKAANSIVDDTQSKYSNSAIPEDQRVAAAENVAFEWSSSRRNKSCMMLQQLVYTSKQMASAYRQLTESWMLLANELEQIDHIDSFNQSTVSSQYTQFNATRSVPKEPVQGANVAPSSVNTSSHMQRAIVPVGIRKFIHRVFVGTDESTLATPIVSSNPPNSKSQERGQSAQISSKPPATQVKTSSDDDETAEPNTPMNRALRSNLSAMVQEENTEEDRQNSLRNDVFRKQRHPHNYASNSNVSHSAAARKHKVKLTANADVVATNDVFVVNNSNHQYDDILAASTPSQQTPGPSQPERGYDWSLRPEESHMNPTGRQRTRSETNTAEATPNGNKTSQYQGNNAKREVAAIPKGSEPFQTVGVSDNEANKPAAKSHHTPSSKSQPTPLHSQGQSKPLPEGWEQVYTDDGAVYYYHKVTRISRWDFPDEQVAAALESRILESQQKVNEAVEKRKLERQEVIRQQQLREEAAEQLQESIKSKLMNWAENASLGRKRPLFELFNTLPVLLGTEFELSTPTPLLTGVSPPIEIKKSYLKIVRVIHPDKLAGDLSIESKLLAENAFILISEIYNDYRKAHNL